MLHGNECPTLKGAELVKTTISYAVQYHVDKILMILDPFPAPCTLKSIKKIVWSIGFGQNPRLHDLLMG